jgi:phage-related holin
MVIAVLGGITGSVVEQVYGVGPDRRLMIGLLLLLIFMDFISGIAASRKDKTYSSEYGIAGGLRVLFILCMPAAANMMDQWLNTPLGAIYYGLTSALIFHTWCSATANAFRAGWEKWIPKWAIKFVESEIKAKISRSSSKKSKPRKRTTNRKGETQHDQNSDPVSDRNASDSHDGSGDGEAL